MTVVSITGLGLTGTLRITWVRDNLAHVLDHSHTDETSGTWTGLACPGHGLAVGTDVDNTTLQRLAAGSEIADLAWEAPDELAADHAGVFQAAMRAHHGGDSERADRLWESLQAIWSQAWSANYAVLEFMQGTGLTRFAPVKPQRWVASFEHHTSPHGLPRPHVHNIVLTSYRPVDSGALCGFGQALVAGTGNAGHGSRSFPGFRYTGLLHNRRNGLSRAERADYGCHGP